MKLGIENRIALVTASTEGIGRGIAQSLKDEGARVILSSRDPKKTEDALKNLGAYGAINCDLNSTDSLWQLTQTMDSKFGKPEILVINTAGAPKGNFQTLSLEDWQKGFQNIFAPALQLIQWALPEMKKKKWGRIVFSTSLAAKEPIPNLLISGAMRAGISNLVKGLARELAADGISVNAILPGWTNTEGVRKLGAIVDPIVAQIPMKRLGDPKEVGSLAAFLSSDQAAYITGQSIAVDGGILHGL